MASKNILKLVLVLVCGLDFTDAMDKGDETPEARAHRLAAIGQRLAAGAIARNEEAPGGTPRSSAGGKATPRGSLARLKRGPSSLVTAASGLLSPNTRARKRATQEQINGIGVKCLESTGELYQQRQLGSTWSIGEINKEKRPFVLKIKTIQIDQLIRVDMPKLQTHLEYVISEDDDQVQFISFIAVGGRAIYNEQRGAIQQDGAEWKFVDMSWDHPDFQFVGPMITITDAKSATAPLASDRPQRPSSNVLPRTYAAWEKRRAPETIHYSNRGVHLTKRGDIRPGAERPTPVYKQHIATGGSRYEGTAYSPPKLGSKPDGVDPKVLDRVSERVAGPHLKAKPLAQLSVPLPDIAAAVVTDIILELRSANGEE